MISPESSTAFYIGDFGIRFYSIIMFFAIICGVLFSVFIAKKSYFAVKPEIIWDMLPILVLSALAGARLYYVVLDWGFYSKNLGEILAVYNGGLSIHGAILGGFAGLIVYVRKNKLNLWNYADVCSYGLILGQIIGRLGNFFNIEAFGKPCYLPEWICLYVPPVKRPVEYLDTAYFHPAFLYEMLWNIFSLFVLCMFAKKLVKINSGVVFLAYLTLYSLGRMIIEPFRLDSVLSINGVHFAEFVSIGLLVFAALMIFARARGKQ